MYRPQNVHSFWHWDSKYDVSKRWYRSCCCHFTGYTYLKTNNSLSRFSSCDCYFLSSLHDRSWDNFDSPKLEYISLRSSTQMIPSRLASIIWKAWRRGKRGNNPNNVDTRRDWLKGHKWTYLQHSLYFSITSHVLKVYMGRVFYTANTCSLLLTLNPRLKSVILICINIVMVLILYWYCTCITN